MGLLDVPILASNLRAGSEKATLAQLTAKSQAEGDTSFVHARSGPILALLPKPSSIQAQQLTIRCYIVNDITRGEGSPPPL